MTFDDYMEEHNPFCMKDKDGKLNYFGRYEDAYLYVMKTLRKYHPRGYVDIILFLIDWVGMDKPMAEDYWADMRKEERELLAEQFIIIDWMEVKKQKDKLAAFMRCLHILTETRFNEVDFEKAWETFLNTFTPVTDEELKLNEMI